MTPATQSPTHLLISPLKNPRDPSQEPRSPPKPLLPPSPEIPQTRGGSLVVSWPFSLVSAPTPTPFHTLLVLFWVIADLACYLLCASNPCLFGNTLLTGVTSSHELLLENTQDSSWAQHVTFSEVSKLSCPPRPNM